MNVSYKTVLGYLEDLAALEPNKKFLGSDERWLDASKALSLVEHIGTALRRMQLSRGSYVALRTERNLETALMILGMRAAGLVAVLCDPKQDVDQLLNSTETPIPAAAMIEQTDRTVFRVTWLNQSPAPAKQIDLLSLAPSEGAPVKTDAQEPAFVIFTSGSTGKSKAVVLSDFNLVNNIVDSEPHGNYSGNDLALGALPLHHVFGLVILLGGVVLGYGTFFQEKMDIPSILTAIQQEKLTIMSGVPVLYMAMAAQSAAYDLSSMRFGYIGGGPVTVKQFTWIEETLRMTLISVYGMSECVGVSCAYYSDPLETRAAGVGPFYSMNTGKILLEDGTEAGPMETGEICVTGPARMIGYLGQPMPPEELLRTGDLGYVDGDGVLHLTGRKKDIIIRNGNNLSSRKIEEALLAVPGVRAAAVVGLPDEMQGEVPAAMVVADGAAGPLDVSLPKNEIPVLYHFVYALPMTSSGKPDRQKIREVLLQCRIG